MFVLEELKSLKRRYLQVLAKNNDIKANLSSKKIIEALMNLVNNNVNNHENTINNNENNENLSPLRLSIGSCNYESPKRPSILDLHDSPDSEMKANIDLIMETTPIKGRMSLECPEPEVIAQDIAALENNNKNEDEEVEAKEEQKEEEEEVFASPEKDTNFNDEEIDLSLLKERESRYSVGSYCSDLMASVELVMETTPLKTADIVHDRESPSHEFEEEEEKEKVVEKEVVVVKNEDEEITKKVLVEKEKETKTNKNTTKKLNNTTTTRNTNTIFKFASPTVEPKMTKAQQLRQEAIKKRSKQLLEQLEKIGKENEDMIFMKPQSHHYTQNKKYTSTKARSISSNNSRSVTASTASHRNRSSVHSHKKSISKQMSSSTQMRSSLTSSKLKQRERVNQQQNDENTNNFEFKARKVPNFSKLHAKYPVKHSRVSIAATASSASSASLSLSEKKMKKNTKITPKSGNKFQSRKLSQCSSRSSGGSGKSRTPMNVTKRR